MDEKSSGSQNK